MYKKSLFSIALIVFVFASFVSPASETQTNSKAISMPDDVKAVIEKSCFGCHNSDSKNDKAKEKLNLSTLDSLSTSKMIHALKDISEVVEDNEMPPEKFLEKYPDKKLTDAEKKILMDWANNQAKTLMN